MPSVSLLATPLPDPVPQEHRNHVCQDQLRFQKHLKTDTMLSRRYYRSVVLSRSSLACVNDVTAIDISNDTVLSGH